MKCDPYGALMIDRGNRILIVLNLYCYSIKHKLSTVLFRFVTLTFWFKTLLSSFLGYFISIYIIYDCINIMGDSKHELGIINMLYYVKGICQITPLPSQNAHLSTTATFVFP